MIPSVLEPPSDLAPAYRRTLGQALLHALGGTQDGALAGPVAALSQLGTAQALDAHAQLFQAGEADAQLWLLVSGTLTLGQHDAQGRWWQSREVGSGEWIDVVSAWCGGPHLETAIAQTEGLAHAFAVDEVARLCDSQPGLCQALLRNVACRARGVTQERQALLTKDIHARLAGWLLEQLRQAGGGDELQLRQQKKDLASQLGVTPETLSRCLRSLHEQGIVKVERYQLSVRNRAALQALAEREPARYSR
jgi:CRP-like cAMP-binding protein